MAFQGGLTDYLIKTVPSFIKFAVNGPGQSTSDTNEVTLYTSPEHILPLARCEGRERKRERRGRGKGECQQEGGREEGVCVCVSRGSSSVSTHMHARARVRACCRCRRSDCALCAWVVASGPLLLMLLYNPQGRHFPPSRLPLLSNSLPPSSRFLRDHVNTQFKSLIDVTGVDFPERASRFEVRFVFHLCGSSVSVCECV